MRTRNHVVVVHLNCHELEHLNEQSKTTGLSREAFLRCLIGNGKVQPKPPESYKDLSLELSKIGNNINQIVRLSNQCGTVNSQQIHRLQEQMSLVWQCLQEYVN